MTRLRSVPVSVLDLAPVVSGRTGTDALAESLDLVRLAERLGYQRYWVAEHHSMPGIASSAPAVLIGALAAATERIRVGSGGVMLPNHPPLVVAEQFGMLASLHPGRIDLGIGRAPGTDPGTAAALRRSAAPLSVEDFPQQLAELTGYLAGHAVDDDAQLFGRSPIRAVPVADEAPPVFLLGSSDYSAQLAGLLGLPFAFAHHFASANTLPALYRYRAAFRPSAELAEPYAVIAASVVVAPTDEEALALALPSALSFLRLRTGHPGPLPTVQEAAEYPYTTLDRELMRSRESSQVAGSPATVAAGLADLLEQTDADELMVTTMVPDHAARLRSYELLAELAIDAAELPV